MEETGTMPAAEEPEVSAVDPGEDTVAGAAEEIVASEEPEVAEPAAPGAAPGSAAEVDVADVIEAPEPAAQPTLDEMVALLAEPTPSVDEPAAAQAATPVAPEEDAESVELAEPVEITESVEPAEPVEPAETAETAEITEPAEPAEASRPAEATEAGEVTEPAETAEDAAAESGTETTGVEAESVEAPEEVIPKPLPPLARRMWTRVPMWVAAAVSLIFVGVIVYLLWPAATGDVTSTLFYRLLVFGGAGLVVVDLVTGCVVWLVARSRAEDDDKVGLAGTLWMRALLWTAAGVGFWWIGFLILDLRHTGVL